jgi:23S rRNA (cytidine1920-2'-O)/16S rRNA (cytidine1409-2'-O)-methyltransferase
MVVARGLAESRAKAQALILAGAIKVNGELRRRTAESVPFDAVVELVDTLPYVSRGGYKLAHALDAFAIDVTGMTAMDVGASTGGFTDVLLQRGARAVYAIDVGYGILDYSLRADPRVIVMERKNIRYVTELPVVDNATLPPTGAVIDVAFISLKLVLPPIKALLAPDAWVVALIKPQFEAGVHLVGKGGVVRDPQVRAGTIEAVLASANAIGWGCAGLVRSPIIGPAGNVEFLAWLHPTGDIPFTTLIKTVELA